MLLIFISFSGGKTSAYMAKLILDMNLPNEMVFIFANTGQEHPETYEFIHKCEKAFGIKIHWVEGVVHHGEKKGSTHKIVDYYTARRDGYMFTAIQGLINKGMPVGYIDIGDEPWEEIDFFTDYLRALEKFRN